MNIKTKRKNKNKDTTILMECLKTVTSIFNCKSPKSSQYNKCNKQGNNAGFQTKTTCYNHPIQP